MAEKTRKKSSTGTTKASGKPPAPPSRKRGSAGDAGDHDHEGEGEGEGEGDNAEKRRALPVKAAPKVTRAKVPFARKNQPPSETEFLARLPVATGKKFENVRTFLKKQKGVAEDLYFYGPKTGWAYRYLRGSHSLATIMLHDDHLMGIVALDAAALAACDFGALSDVGQRARKVAHGSPSLLWLDLPLDGSGASDFKALLKAKLKVMPTPGPPPPPPPPARPR